MSIRPVTQGRPFEATPRERKEAMQQKLFQLSGIVFVALVLVTIVGIGGSTPGTDDSATEVASFYSDNEARQFIASFMLAATVPFLVFFAIGLAGTPAVREGRGSSWSRVVIAGAILAGGAILATALIHFALLDVASDEQVSPDAVLALNMLDGSTWVAFNAGFGVMMLGAAGVFLTGAFHRWLGWVALVLGIALFIPFADFVALLGTLVWIVVTSIALARARSESAYVAAPGAA
jgi:hypothetical protein